MQKKLKQGKNIVEKTAININDQFFNYLFFICH